MADPLAPIRKLLRLHGGGGGGTAVTLGMSPGLGARPKWRHFRPVVFSLTVAVVDGLLSWLFLSLGLRGFRQDADCHSHRFFLIRSVSFPLCLQEG